MKSAFTILFLAITATSLSAGTILSVTGPPVKNPIGIFPFSAVAFSFTVGESYSDVSIGVDLIGSFSGSAYLTTQIGYGTIAANQIATSSFTSAGASSGTVQTVLQNISIGPGTYFLVLSSTQDTPPQGLEETNSPVTVNDPGASTNGRLWFAESPADYAPASDFGLASGGGGAFAPQFTISSNSGIQVSINPNGVVPIFSSATSIQPGSWVSIFGKNFASSTSVWSGDFPTTLGGVTVTIDSKPAYLWFVSPTQINLQAPDDSPAGSVSVVVNTPGGSASSTVSLSQFSPSFSLLDSTHVAGVIPTPDGSGAYGGGTYDIVGPTGYFSYTTRPVKAGEALQLYGVGFGPTDPAVQAGKAFGGAAPANNPVYITIGGVSADVQFAGITSAGLYQLNVVVPDVPGGDQPLQASVVGFPTQPTVYVTVQ
jgi:uncharacterized protein (TIGR03437 family)